MTTAVGSAQLSSNRLLSLWYGHLSCPSLIEKNSVAGDTPRSSICPAQITPELSGKLCAAGIDPDTPCLTVSCATQEQQQIRLNTLESLGKTDGLPEPAQDIVGGVAGAYADERDRTADSSVSPLRSVLK